jgi:hypothetical protein
VANQPRSQHTRQESVEQLVPTRDGMRPGRWIVAPRDTFHWTNDATRQGQQKRRLYLLCEGRPAGHAVAVQARWICACGDNGQWRTNQTDVTADAELHAAQHNSPTQAPNTAPADQPARPQTRGAMS